MREAFFRFTYGKRHDDKSWKLQFHQREDEKEMKKAKIKSKFSFFIYLYLESRKTMNYGNLHSKTRSSQGAAGLVGSALKNQIMDKLQNKTV